MGCNNNKVGLNTHAKSKESREAKRQGEHKLDIDVLIAVCRISRIIALTLLGATSRVGEGDRHFDDWRGYKCLESVHELGESTFEASRYLPRCGVMMLGATRPL